MTKLNGKAVVVGEKILTACHCISVDMERQPTLDTNTLVQLQTASEKPFYANIEFADPISDLAILGCPDGQCFPGRARLYEDCVAFSEIEIYIDDLPPKSNVHVRNRDGEWVEGTAEFFSPNRLSLDAHDRIYPGASGGPIVIGGKLAAVVSNTSLEPHDGMFHGFHPLLTKALPRWW